MKRSTPLKRTEFKRKPAGGLTGVLSATSFARTKASDEKPKRKPMKSRGMQGRPPTADEQRFMDAIGGLGCIACRKDGIENSLISIHHLQGRTAPGAHFKTLPLCGPHHQQDDTDPMGRISVHGSRKQFEARYGTQYELLAECIELINSGKPSECESPGCLTNISKG